MVFSLMSEMCVLLLIASIGLVMRKKQVLPKELNAVTTQLILNVTLPALIIYSMNVELTMELFVDALSLIGLSIYGLTSATVIAHVMRKKAKLERERLGVYEATIVFGNQGFLGYAIAFLLFGEIGVLYTAFFMIFFLFYVWTYVLYVVARTEYKIKLTQLFLNPGVVSTAIGILLILLPFTLPTMVNQLLFDIGTMTVPLSMLLIGSMLAEIRFNEFIDIMKNRYIWYATGAKLLLLPILFFPFLTLPISSVVMTIAILVTGTPSAPSVPMYATKYGGDVSFASVIVAITTILCVLTIPLLYGLILFVQ